MFKLKFYSMVDTPSISSVKLLFEIMIISTMQICDTINLENDLSSSNVIVKHIDTKMLKRWRWWAQGIKSFVKTSLFPFFTEI